MPRTIVTEPLTRAAFAPFGQVIEVAGADHFPINGGNTERFHDLAKVELEGPSARALVSIMRGKPFTLPFTLRFVERHPLGSQAFYPLSGRPFLVLVAPDHEGVPGTPRAFLASRDQGVNLARGTWHGVLTPLEAESDFFIVDRGGEGVNVEEHHFAEPWVVVPG